MRFTGIPADALAFYAELEAHNDREWFAANKERYETSVREPFAALVDALADEFGEAKLFRPYRDVRFSLDKTPFKTEQGAVAGDHETGSTGYWVSLDADGIRAGGGWFHGATDQLARFRQAVAGAPGKELQDIVETLRRKRFQRGGEVLKTAPRGYDKDHGRIDLLRHKDLIASRDHGAPAWLHTGAVARHVRDDWRAVRPMVEWIQVNVGPSDQPIREPGDPR